ncbi:hypothetical protein M413DRAFT_440526 [Hebeloma cylindrosporum]|uniref:Uncharacterized protein n=1 Tax=Hebeloma cylindrosporum TaxID=76867 RepID=A0A0C3CSB6_HEBCY|nr:hypothetical protein M413DRAFT_440526 [Hebeloma cylindrosporum h7]
MFRSSSRSPRPSESSRPTSPSSPKKYRLGMAGVANLFIRMRRFEDAALSNSRHEVMSSGEPQSHPGLAEACQDQGQASVELTDNFVCAGGVNVTTLLRATRTSLLERVEPLGANALLDEQWECKIAKPKPAHKGPYKVQVHYSACAARSPVADPHKPVNLDKAKNVPGLMTIIKRNED